MSEKGPLSPIAINAVAIMFVLVGLPFAVSLIANSSVDSEDMIEVPGDGTTVNNRHDQWITMNQTGVISDDPSDSYCGGYGYGGADYFPLYENCPTVQGTTMFNFNGDRYQTMETCDPTTLAGGSNRESCGDGPYTFILNTGVIQDDLQNRTLTEINIDMLAYDVFAGNSFQCDNPTIFNDITGTLNVWFNTGYLNYSYPASGVTPSTPVPYTYQSTNALNVFDGVFSSVNSIVVDSVSNTTSRSVDYMCQYAFSITIPITAMNGFMISDMAENNDYYNQSWFVITLDDLQVPDLSQGLEQSGLRVPFFPTQGVTGNDDYLIHVEFGVISEASKSLSVQAATLLLSIGIFGIALASTEAWDPFMERVRNV